MQNLRYFNIIAVSYEIVSFKKKNKTKNKLHLIHLYGVISYNCYNKVMQTEVKGHFSAKNAYFHALLQLPV